jgi:flagellar biosynthesis protein FlhG
MLLAPCSMLITMADQADQLRTLVDTAEPCAREVQVGPAIVVVAGGRAGVGVTTVAANLAAALSRAGRRVLVMEAVEDRSALAAAMGVRKTGEFSLADVMAGECEVGDAMVDGPAGVSILAQGRLPARTKPASSPRRVVNRRVAGTVGERFLAGLASLARDVDTIVVDAGCVSNASARRLWLRSSMVVLVTTAEGPAILDAYAMLKQSVVDATGPDVRLLVNQCENERASAAAQARFASACERFLGRAVPALPALPRDASCAHAGDRAWLRMWEGADTEFGRAALWLGRAVGDVLRGESAGSAERDLRRCAVA